MVLRVIEAPWSLFQTIPNSLSRYQHIRRKHKPELKQIVPAIPEIWAFKKLLIFFIFFFSLHTWKKYCQIKCKWAIRLPSYLAHINSDIRHTKVTIHLNFHSYFFFHNSHFLAATCISQLVSYLPFCIGPQPFLQLGEISEDNFWISYT